MAKKKKFDLSKLVHDDHLTDNQNVYFVSDPSKKCQVHKQPTGEYKLMKPDGKTLTTVHAFVIECLGTEPANHAANWLRVDSGKTLFEMWSADDMADAA